MTLFSPDSTITSDATAGEVSFLLGWALFELLASAYPDRVRIASSDDEWLTAPGHTIFVPVGDGKHVSDFARSMLPTVQREIGRQLEADPRSHDWFIEYDYWAHAMSGDSKNLGHGLRFDVVVQVHG